MTDLEKMADEIQRLSGLGMLRKTGELRHRGKNPRLIPDTSIISEAAKRKMRENANL